MAERASAQIIIGGRITLAVLGALVEVAQAEDVRVDWDDEPVEVQDVIAAAGAGESIKLCRHEVAGATFDDLETFLVKHKVPFVRESDGYSGQWEPGRVTYRGDDAEPKDWPTNDRHELVITEGQLNQLGSLEAVRAYFEEGDFIVPGLELVDSLEVAAG